MPQGLGEGVCLVPECPFGGEDLHRGNAVAHQDPQPLAGAFQMPPPPRECRAAQQKAFQPEGLGAHDLLRDCREAGLGEQHHVHPPLGNRLPLHAHGREVGMRHAQWPRLGVHVPESQQREGGGSHGHIIKGGALSHRHPSGVVGKGRSARPTHKLNCRRSKGVRGGVRGGEASHACRSAALLGQTGPLH